MNPTNHLIFFILITTLIRPNPSLAIPRNTTFDFSSLQPENLTLLGDSHFQNDVVSLTIQSETPSSSSGTIIYTAPIRFSDNRTNSTTSFSTSFSFSITNYGPNSPVSPVLGGGLSFFISPGNQTLGSPGGYLGLVNASMLTQNRFIAIEFDTRLDAHFHDPNDNHVGLDIDSLNSIKSVDCMLFGIDLRSGVSSFTSWIDYFHELKNLKVFLTRSRLKPDSPILSVDIDLSGYFEEYMYVGFSGSTQGSTESHWIESWSFNSSGIKHFNPKNDNPYNVSSEMVPIQISGHSGYSKYRRKLGYGLGVSGPMFVFAVLVLVGYIAVKKWKEIKIETSIKTGFKRGPRQFSYKELKMATNNFHLSRIIGHGAFGIVYKAFLISSGATSAAVKRSMCSPEAKDDFLAELSVIARLRHKNLVQLLGWCVEKGEFLLVYELMPYGSIDKVLYQDPDLLGFLTWNRRYKIAIGLASVLAYLHQECDKLVIHRDIKSSNVMLDEHFNARLGDFGLARLIDHNKSPVSTLTAGTMGYLAPEYLHCGKATDKTDVYSYGVVVLEVCCGRRPIEKETGVEKMVNLVDWVWDLYAKDEILDAIDERLNGEFNKDEARRLLMVGLSCVNPRSEMRPTMGRVLQILNRDAEEEMAVVPLMKPKVSFCASLPLNVEDLVFCSEDDDDEQESDSSCTTLDGGFEIRIEGSSF
uniref:probable L-type lectin-domain containing receptor kinase S.7 n=1 Tax=Erigeron canadensis TaxID=72917 RepID=UPI001CB8E2AC|nr:probable L-type lectin-domain containing receptor kinase S.7 [Erigeron canadensis]